MAGRSGAAAARTRAPEPASEAWTDLMCSVPGRLLDAVREADCLRGDQRRPDFQLDLSVCIQRDVAGVSLVDLAVVEGGHVAAGGADPVRAERLAPLVEHLTQGVGALDRGLDVD